ncbi:hypothetical protein [Sphingobium sp. YR768]|uniref:hypothetical protein n=1 Tax=Sphingobium sp. YR768 TaxID=1884365 RepID=UPI000B864327|nr:hypothetical protein [Sphingobium sp. YR768]
MLTLTAFNAKGSKTAVMTFGRIMQDGKPSFFRPLSAAELSLIKASSRLLVSSAQWAAVFTGRGAARQLSGVQS